MLTPDWLQVLDELSLANIRQISENITRKFGARSDREDEDSDANAGFGCAGNAFGYQTLNNRQGESVLITYVSPDDGRILGG